MSSFNNVALTAERRVERSPSDLFKPAIVSVRLDIISENKVLVCQVNRGDQGSKWSECQVCQGSSGQGNQGYQWSKCGITLRE